MQHHIIPNPVQPPPCPPSSTDRRPSSLIIERNPSSQGVSAATAAQLRRRLDPSAGRHLDDAGRENQEKAGHSQTFSSSRPPSQGGERQSDRQRAKMVKPYEAEGESTSFLPGNTSDRQGGAQKSRTRSCLALLTRRRKSIAFIFVSIVLVSQLWFWAPALLGEERTSEWGHAIDQWRPWRPHHPSVSTASSRPPAQTTEPVPVPIATSVAGIPIYRPKTMLPLDYEDPMTPEEERLTIEAQAFPPEVVTYGKNDKPAKAVYNYLEGDPHHGVIPPTQLLILDRDIPRLPPMKGEDVPSYPPTRWVAHSGWSRAANGSRTTMEDALNPDIQHPENDWRPKPFNLWRRPHFNVLSRSLRRQTNMLPRVQYAFPASDRFSGQTNNAERDAVLERRRRLVRNAFLHSWEGYKRHAWGHDEIKPVSGSSSDSFNGWGATIVDALDTLLVMDLPAEYDLARQHVRDIDFYLLGGSRSAYGNSDGRVPVFETAIRYLGGFLSAYDLSGDELMRDRAEELAQLIMPAFETMTGVPVGRLRLDDPGSPFHSTSVIVAEAASMLLEMTRLWQVTGNRTYFDRVHRITDWLQYNMTGTPDRLGSLLPASIFPERGSMYGWYSWGGMIDSTFEYLIKEHQLLGGRLEQYGRFFADVVDSANRWLLRTTNAVPNTPLLVLGQSNGKTFRPKLEHLACFAGGSIGLGAKLLKRERDLDIARRVTETCWWAYNSTATGIGPEEVVFYSDKDTDRYESTVLPGGTIRRGRARGAPVVGVRNVAADYRNRPETIESVFYMWRITGDPKWQERGWQMFCSWVTHSMTKFGFSSISNVHAVPAMLTDSMESFVFAETFKYYYLLFSPPSLISLDEYVFTTEAHPLLLPKNGKWAKAGQGSRPFWDPKLPHVPVAKDQYSGGEMGPVGGLTRAQKSFIYETWQKEIKAAEAERKAKEKSLLNKEMLSNQFRRIISSATAVADGFTSMEQVEQDEDAEVDGDEEMLVDEGVRFVNPASE